MKAGEECGECLKGLAAKMADAAAGGDEEVRKTCLRAALEIHRFMYLPGESVPTRVATAMLREVARVARNPDPFSMIKREEFEKGVKAAKRLAHLFGSDLEGLIRLSVAGNRIDFFRDISEVEREWRESANDFSVDDTLELAAAIGEGGPVLLLADNAGELPFDMPLIEECRRRSIELVYAVKGAPSQNDLTGRDMADYGVKLANVVDTGTGRVGCDLEAVGGDFMREWERAKVVLSKGMANLETLSEYPGEIRGKRLFFALVVKCPPVSRFLGLPLGFPAVLAAGRLG